MLKQSKIIVSVAIASVMLMASCAEKKSSQQSGVSAYSAAVADSLSENNKPLFADEGRVVDSLYRANGCVYTTELEKAAENGDLDATRMLVTMYAYGIGGVKADRKRAYLLYRNLAEQKDADAQAHLGYMMVYGLGPVQDNEQGLIWLQESANQRCPMAFYYLGHYFQQTDDIKNAKVCFQNAVALGMPEAQACLDNLINE
ncbi:MAG: sel1 repeat family protein [Bacteroidales bacterium]|nr:sel1 repeat family protein [Bacteroidales bacterium]